jgi:hypothetical protein
MMTAEQFEETLRQLFRRRPFRPFVVELMEGRVIEAGQPSVVFGGGAASFFTPAYELVEFGCEDERAIRQGTAATAP